MLNKNALYTSILLIALLYSCATLTTGKRSESAWNELGGVVEKRSFVIEADWAFPLMTQGIAQVANSGLLMPGSNANRIDLMGNSNYFRVSGDSVYISLPYFGERQIGGGYGNSDVGLKFEGIPSSYAVKKDEGKNNYIIDIAIRDKVETLRFNLFLFPSGKADINVNSSHRSSIRYSGRLLPEPQKGS